MVTTLLVDDEPDIRMLMRMILRHVRGLEVLGEAADGAEAVAQVDALQPDVVVLDNRMPEMTGLEAAAAILERNPLQAIILFSAFLDESINEEAARLGVRHCLPKGEINRLPEVLAGLAF